MKITYSLTKNDILQMQLFNASISKQIQNTRRNTRLWVSIVYIVLALIILNSNYWLIGIVFFIVAILWFFIYPLYDAKRYLKYYSKFIDENLGKKSEQPGELVFGDEYIIDTDYSGESKIKINSIERIDEVRDYCFLKLNSGNGMVIPLYQLPNKDEVISYLKLMASMHGIAYTTNAEWKWK